MGFSKSMARLARRPGTRLPALFGLLAAIILLAFPGLAHAQGAVRSVHGDWQIRCDTPPGAQTEQCALIQSVTAEDRPNVGLTVIALKTAKPNAIAPITRIRFSFALFVGGTLSRRRPVRMRRNGSPHMFSTRP